MSESVTPTRHTWLHPDRLSPDPAIGRPARLRSDGLYEMALHPHRLVAAQPETAATREWADQLNLFTPAPPLKIVPDKTGRARLLLDFGTEMHGVLDLVVRVPGLATLQFTFGESELEAAGRLPNQFPCPDVFVTLPGAGRHERRIAELTQRTPWRYDTKVDSRRKWWPCQTAPAG